VPAAGSARTSASDGLSVGTDPSGHVVTNIYRAIRRLFGWDRNDVYALEWTWFLRGSWGSTAAGLPGLQFHDLRQLAAMPAAFTGATTRELMARMGHSSPRVAMIHPYATASRDALSAAAMSGLAVSQGAKALSDGRVRQMPKRRK
jgi:hypothetical protein